MLFGKIPDEDLKMTSFEADTSAAALVLYNYGKAEIENPSGSIYLRWEHHKRIKILKKQGFGYGNISIPFYSFNKREEFFFDKADVCLPNGDKIKLNKKQVFIEKVNDYWSVARFTFPQMEEGCVIEYSYFINSQNITELREWYFQEDIPVRWSELRVKFPQFLIYVYLFQGNEGMTKVEEKDGETIYKGKNGICRLSDGRFIMQDAPALRPEAFITTMDDYLAKIKFQLSEVHYPDGRKDKVMTSWKVFENDIDHAPYFGEQFLKKQNYKKMVEKLLPQVEQFSTESEKALFLYNYLATNLKWNGGFSVFTRSEKLDDIFETGEGSSAELNMMLYVLLREAGITAYPLLVSTRSHGKMYEEYPILDQFNHLMVLALPDANRTILDVAGPFHPPGYPAIDALNSRALMLRPEGTPSWMNIQAPADGADIYACELDLSEDGTLSGVLKGAYRGYNAIPERRHYEKDAAGVHWKDRLVKKYPDISVDSVRFSALSQVAETFLDTVYLHIPNAAQVSGGFIYLSPVLHSGFDENIFKMQERNYPVDVPYPILEQHILKLNLPEGFQVEALPEPASFSLPGNGGSFRFAVEEKTPGELSLIARLQVSQLKFMQEEYPNVKELFDLVVEKFGEQIVLKKAD